MPPPLREAAGLGVSYRPMTEADLPFSAEVYISTRGEEVAATGWPAEAQVAFLLQQHEAQHRHYLLHFPHAERLIIERGGEPIGRLYWRDDPEMLHIVDIALLPASRGLGIGGAILADFIAMANARGKGASIYVEQTNRARGLYERLGFEAVEDHGVHQLMRRPAG